MTRCVCVCVSACMLSVYGQRLMLNVSESETKQFRGFVSDRDSIAKCLRRVDWWRHWSRHATLLYDVSTLCAPNVILSAAPVKKSPALYLIRHCTSGLSTNSPNCKKTHLEEYISNSRGFYPRDAMLARVIAIATCPSVCLSIRLSVRHVPVLCQNEES